MVFTQEKALMHMSFSGVIQMKCAVFRVFAPAAVRISVIGEFNGVAGYTDE